MGHPLAKICGLQADPLVFHQKADIDPEILEPDKFGLPRVRPAVSGEQYSEYVVAARLHGHQYGASVGEDFIQHERNRFGILRYLDIATGRDIPEELGYVPCRARLPAHFGESLDYPLDGASAEEPEAEHQTCESIFVREWNSAGACLRAKGPAPVLVEELARDPIPRGQCGNHPPVRPIS